MSPLPDNLRRAPNAASRHFLSGQHRGQLPRHRLLARFLKQRRLIQELLPSAAPPPLGASSTNQSSTKLFVCSMSSVHLLCPLHQAVSTTPSPPSVVRLKAQDTTLQYTHVHLYLKSNLHVGWCSSRIRVLICDMIGERDKFDDSSLSGK
ncbi:uncharacterized protein LOC119268188 isoform X2 [Triticum dicoccoides]|uniref:uncharacterized protein LOC119268188 isoform X2 n=1 Tax=Triticum dicoccoides TaxID=85692 RepID=UPI00188FC69C|nr:uncharacterized protein LOC119268188 isoform X2 [Triticum dicoccoides]